VKAHRFRGEFLEGSGNRSYRENLPEYEGMFSRRLNMPLQPPSPVQYQGIATKHP
jgi:hypothetical protein